MVVVLVTMINGSQPTNKSYNGYHHTTTETSLLLHPPPSSYRGIIDSLPLDLLDGGDGIQSRESIQYILDKLGVLLQSLVVVVVVVVVMVVGGGGEGGQERRSGW